MAASTIAFAAPASAPAKTDALPAQLKDAKKQLAVAESKKADAELALERMDRELAKYSDEVAHLREDIEAKRKQFERLSDDNVDRQRKLTAIKQQIAQVARAAYQLGRQPYLKILFDNANATSAGRGLAYYEYFIRSQSQHLNDLQHRMAEFEPIQHQLGLEQEALSQLLRRQETEKAELDRRREQRAQLLSRASAKVQDRRQRVQRLIDDQARLKRLTGEIGRAAQDSIGGPLSSGTAFADLKGRLAWPVDGTVLARFGAAHPVATQQRSHGVLFGSAHGAAVRAVWDGRVVFADWLTGFGFMTILDHGSGYLSLYGYNEANLKAVGDSVQANEVIGRVGASGWLEGPALYFEIRFEGKPINPSPWLAKR